jgi:plastocyanin
MLRARLWIMLAIAAAAVLALPPVGSVRAQDTSYSLTINDDNFEPAKLEVKAGVKFKLMVKNARKVAAEFESSELNREKVVPAGQTAVINIGPLKPGTYPFIDDFHKTTRGEIIAK